MECKALRRRYLRTLDRIRPHSRAPGCAIDDRADSFTDYVFRNRQAVYGIIEADLSPDTTLSASVQYQQDTSLNHFGVPYGRDGRDANLPRSSFWGDSNYRLARDYTIYTVGVSHRLANDWTVRGTYSRQRTVNDIDNFNSLTGSLDVTTGNGLSIASRSRNNSSVLSSDSADVVSAALFRLDQSNLAVRDDSIPSDLGNACGGICYDAAGKVVSQGVNLGVNGKVGRNLNLAAGYTFTDAEYKAGPQQGQRFGPEQPRHSIRIAAHYKLPDTDWSFAGNVETRSKIYRNGGSGASAWTIRQGALVLLGVHARYQLTPKTLVLIAISNLTDRRYRGLYSLNYSPYGEPRRVSVNLKHVF